MYFEVPQDSYPQETWGAQALGLNNMVFLGPFQLGCGLGPRSHSLISRGLGLWGNTANCFVLSGSESETPYALSEKVEAGI